MDRFFRRTGFCLTGIFMTGAALANPDFSGTLEACMDMPFPQGHTAEDRDASRSAWRQTARTFGWVTIGEVSQAADMPRVSQKAAESDMTVETYLDFMDKAGFAIADQALIDATVPLSRMMAVTTLSFVMPPEVYEEYIAQALQTDRTDATLFSMRSDGMHIFLSGRDASSVFTVSEHLGKRECIFATTSQKSGLADTELLSGVSANFVEADTESSDLFELRRYSHVPDGMRGAQAYQIVWSTEGLAQFPKLDPEARTFVLFSVRPEG